ncbi:MAG: hypothetical protein WBN07_09045 [Woeseiaceae bacterium]
MTRSRKARRERKQRLKQQATAGKEHDPPYPICPDCGERHAPDMEWGDHGDWDGEDDCGSGDVFYPFPEQAFDQWNDCEESFYLPNGVMLKFFANKLVVRAPETLRDSCELLDIILNSILRRYSDQGRSQGPYHGRGIEAVMAFFQGRDLSIDIDYWPEEG